MHLELFTWYQNDGNKNKINKQTKICCLNGLCGNLNIFDIFFSTAFLLHLCYIFLLLKKVFYYLCSPLKSVHKVVDIYILLKTLVIINTFFNYFSVFVFCHCGQISRQVLFIDAKSGNKLAKKHSD